MLNKLLLILKVLVMFERPSKNFLKNHCLISPYLDKLWDYLEKIELKKSVNPKESMEYVDILFDNFFFLYAQKRHFSEPIMEVLAKGLISAVTIIDEHFTAIQEKGPLSIYGYPCSKTLQKKEVAMQEAYFYSRSTMDSNPYIGYCTRNLNGKLIRQIFYPEEINDINLFYSLYSFLNNLKDEQLLERQYIPALQNLLVKKDSMMNHQALFTVWSLYSMKGFIMLQMLLEFYDEKCIGDANYALYDSQVKKFTKFLEKAHTFSQPKLARDEMVLELIEKIKKREEAHVFSTALSGLKKLSNYYQKKIYDIVNE